MTTGTSNATKLDAFERLPVAWSSRAGTDDAGEAIGVSALAVHVHDPL
ncbi:hypothetical protein [Cryobacterium sp. PH31-L1]|nr:hypothetical protein [Cryobacterium sp. PH31-L1]MDJ0376130.1 hypothetical protein [Cryobacterium sp. PH31-L1]